MGEQAVIENTPTLATERLILRRFMPSEVLALFRIFSDRQANTFLPVFPLENMAQAEAYLKLRFLEHYKRPRGYRYAICQKSDLEPIGYINVSDDDSRDLGYGLRPEHWGRGIAAEAARAVLERLRVDGFPYVTATHDVKNPRSGAVMKKIGMTYRYSYEEQWQPKDLLVTFRMYQIDFSPNAATYPRYWQQSAVHFIEETL